MVVRQTDIARRVVEAFFSRRNSMAEAAESRRNMDQSQRAIAASRELLQRIRQRQRDNAAQAREEADPAPSAVSAFEADIIRRVFHDLVLETRAPECHWRDLAKGLVHEFTGCEQIEADLLDWITRA